MKTNSAPINSLSILILAVFCRDGSNPLAANLPLQVAQGPLVEENHHQQLRTSEPRPPSTEGIDLLLEHKAPSPPLEPGPRPPAPPDDHITALFNKNPAGFPAAYNQWLEQQQQGRGERAAVSTKRRSPTYDQFITAAIVTELNLKRATYTMFAPSDAFLRANNISLTFTALRDKDCVRQIVQSHVVLGRIPLSEGIEDVALSMLDTPIFFSAREANGIGVVRANIEADYGTVHIINGLMDKQRLIDSCPSLRLNLQRVASEGQQVPSSSSLHTISLRKVSDEDFLPVGPDDSSITANEINNLFNYNDDVDVVVPFPDPADYSSSEANVPLELLVNIDNFAVAWAKMSAEDSVIATLQNLGASTFLALLERSNLMETLTSQGPWTIFAPDNSAWQNLPAETFDHIMKDQILLEQIISYHIAPSNATRRTFTNDQKLPSLYEDYPIHINLYSDGFASWYTASGSLITNLDELASNGVVHIISSVLFPPLGDLYSTVKWTPALQTAFSMLQTVASDFSNSSLALTAFLPVDSPLLDASLTGLNDPLILAGILRRHVVRGTWFVSGLVDGDRLETFGGEVLSLSHDGDCVGINGACIVVRDITLTNGVLHVIDKLI